MSGAAGAWAMVIEKFWEAAGVTPSPTPLVAVTVPVNTPAEVGLPESRPVVEFSVTPGGKAPELTLKTGVGEPLAV